METITNTPEKLILRMEANEPLANAIRRSLSDVPTLAIDDVEIYKNDSALYDEVLANRLGQIPLKTDKSMSAKTKIDFKLTKKGPGTVYAEDLQGPSEIVEPKIPITILGENHKLELVATATLGTGHDHAKHVPGLCYYRHILEVKSTPKTDKIVQDQKGLIKPEKKGSKWLADLSESQVTEIEEADSNAITDSKEIILIIESYGVMPAKDILANAVKALEDNLTSLEKQIK